MRRLTFNHRVIVVLLLALLIAVTLAAPILYSRIVEHHLVTVVAPPLEQQFGFRAEYAMAEHGRERVFRLTEVSPAGVLGRAGARSGDMPSPPFCRYSGDHLAAEHFLGRLQEAARGRAIVVKMLRPSAPEAGFYTLEVGLKAGQP